MIKILVNGAFDLLHRGHLDLLNEAKLIGDYLLVALDTDKRIGKAKGPDRPINNQDTIDIIKETDVRIIGSDWKDKPIVGELYCKELLFYDRVNNESTTKTIENYINRRQLLR